jgi:signal transduction histidine kinase
MLSATDSMIENTRKRLEASALAVARMASAEALYAYENWTDVLGDPDLLPRYLAQKQRLRDTFDGEAGGIEAAYYLRLVSADSYQRAGLSAAQYAALDPEGRGVMQVIMDNGPMGARELLSIEERGQNPAEGEPQSPEGWADYSLILDSRSGLSYVNFMRCVPRERLADLVLAQAADHSLTVTGRLRPRAGEADGRADAGAAYLSAYAPVLDRDGRPTDILAGVDMRDDVAAAARTAATVLTVVLIVAAVIVLSAGGLAVILFRKKAMQAESASRAKSSFLSRMSHEMRTPMNAIMGLSRMAAETPDAAKKDEYLDNIAVASKHLRQVIDDVLDLSKIESGKARQELAEIDFFKEMAGVEQLIRPQVEMKGQTLSFRIDKSIPKIVIGDGTHLRQIVVNLLSNAVKFTPEKGTISLYAEMLSIDDERCLIEWRVKDSGIGMDEATLARLFQPFEQGDNSTTRRYGGTGLGLVISKQFIEMMEGTIRVESVKGKGSEFIFTIRLYLPGTVKAAALKRDDGPYTLPDLNGMNFLLVEDAELNRLIAVNLFEGYGAAVDTAKNGLDGYQKFCRNPDKYDIIFMDIQMPIMDGYEAAVKIRASGVKNAATVPIIAMTADVFKEDIEKALSAGMNEHVGKPFETEQIERAITRVLQKD